MTLREQLREVIDEAVAKGLRRREIQDALRDILEQLAAVEPVDGADAIEF